MIVLKSIGTGIWLSQGEEHLWFRRHILWFGSGWWRWKIVYYDIRTTVFIQLASAYRKTIDSPHRVGFSRSASINCYWHRRFFPRTRRRDSTSRANRSKQTTRTASVIMRWQYLATVASRRVRANWWARHTDGYVSSNPNLPNERRAVGLNISRTPGIIATASWTPTSPLSNRFAILRRFLVSLRSVPKSVFRSSRLLGLC